MNENVKENGFIPGKSWLGVKIRNLKVDFKTGGTWRWVGQWTLMIKINDFLVVQSQNTGV